MSSVVVRTAALKPERRYLQFSLGTMLLAVTLLCIWLGVQVKWIRDRQEARRWLEEHDCKFYSNVDVDPNDPFRGPEPKSAPWPIRILGEEGMSEIYLNLHVISSDEAKLRKTLLEQQFPEAQVRIRSGPEWLDGALGRRLKDNPFQGLLGSPHSVLTLPPPIKVSKLPPFVDRLAVALLAAFLQRR